MRNLDPKQYTPVEYLKRVQISRRNYKMKFKYAIRSSRLIGLFVHSQTELGV